VYLYESCPYNQLNKSEGVAVPESRIYIWCGVNEMEGFRRARGLDKKTLMAAGRRRTKAVGRRWLDESGQTAGGRALVLLHPEEAHDAVHLAVTGVKASLFMGFRAKASGADAAEFSYRGSASGTSSLRDDLTVGHRTIVS
jgi:hypothetical protein